MLLLLSIACIRTPETVDSQAAVEVFTCPADARFWSPDASTEACVDDDGELHGPWQRYDGDVVVAESSWTHGLQDGRYVSRHTDGSHKVEGRYSLGSKDGLWTARRTDGRPDWEEHYDAGELDWRTEYGVDGELKSEVHFAEGRREGVATWFYSDGTPRNRLMYDAGTRNGPSVSWHPNGAMKAMGDYDHDRRDGAWFTWSSTGELISEERWSAGELVGVDGVLDADPLCPAGTAPIVERHDAGATEVCETPSGVRHGPTTARYVDGSLRRVGAYAGGLPSGEWMSWCPDGLPASRGDYVDGQRIGEWTTWSCATGELLRVEKVS